MKNVNSMKNKKFDSKSKNNQFVNETFLILKNFVVISITINNITNFFDITKNDDDFSFKKTRRQKIRFLINFFFLKSLIFLMHKKNLRVVIRKIYITSRRR